MVNVIEQGDTKKLSSFKLDFLVYTISLSSLTTEKLSFTSLLIPRTRGINILTIILIFLLMISCNKDDSEVENDFSIVEFTTVELPKRPGPRPQTTMDVPHVQIGVEPVPDVNEELFRRVYAVPGIEKHPSVIGSWTGLWLAEDVIVSKPEALIGGREFAHIHADGSLHIFLEPSRSHEAVDSCWAIFHPFALQTQDTGVQIDPEEQLKSWDGFVMLYTPQSIEELNVTFQLIVDGYNHVAGQNLLATDYY